MKIIFSCVLTLFVFISKAGTPCVNKIVYGFQNFTDGCTNKYQSINWSLLTHFAFSSVGFDSNGNIITNNNCYNPSSGLVNMAHTNGVKVVIMVWSPGNTSIVDNVLASSTKMQTLANTLITYMQTYNLDGTNIDFENVPITNSVDGQPNKSKVIAFAQVLYTTLKSANPNYHITWSTPYTKECQFIKPVWDFGAIASYSDCFTVMSYDYIAGNTGWTGSHQPFAGGPMYGSAYGSSANKLQYNFQNTVAEYLSAGVPASKIVMGEGFYGVEWTNLSNGTPGVFGASGGTTLNYNMMAANASAKGKQWFTTEKTHYYSYQSGNWVQGFFDSDSTLGIKLDYIKNQNLGGLMIWALHYDSGRVELWNKIQNKLCSATGLNENSFNGKFSVYPNPSNGQFTVSGFQFPVQVRIYNVIGDKIFETTANSNEETINLKEKDGIYFLELRYENKVERMKLIVN